MVFETPSIKLRVASAITLIIFSHYLLAACIILTTCVYWQLLKTCAKEPNSLTLLLASKSLCVKQISNDEIDKIDPIFYNDVKTATFKGLDLN